MRIALVGVLLLQVGPCIDTRQRAGTTGGRYASAPVDECEDLRRQSLAICTFKRQTGCRGDEVQHTMDGDFRDKAWYRVEGCGQELDCVYSNENETRMRCSWPHDVEPVRERLTIESGCSLDSIQATAQQRIYRHPEARWRDRMLDSVAWRLDACGRPYACTATVERPQVVYDRRGNAKEPDYNWKDELPQRIECRAAAAQPVTEPVVEKREPPHRAAAPEPPEDCGPSNCTGCCTQTGQCSLGNMNDRACGIGGLACASCSDRADGLVHCGPRYTCVK